MLAEELVDLAQSIQKQKDPIYGLATLTCL